MNLKAKSSKLSKKAHLKINSLFRDKNFVGFILVLFLFYIIFYNHLDNDIKRKIFNTVSNPFVLLFSIALCGCILYVNFTLGMIFVFTLIISLTLNTSSDSFTATSSSNLPSIEEGFTTTLPIPIPLLDNYKKKKRSNKEDVLEGFKSKNFLESKIEQLTNDLEEGLKENDAIEEKYKNTLNKEEFSSTNSDDESQKDKKNKHSKKEHYSSNNNNKNKNNKKEKTIKKRTFDFTNKEDKSLVYTREVLKEVVNRINYEYEDKDYLKKYIGSKFEEIIDLLGLLDDE
jgi:hypothetical protein